MASRQWSMPRRRTTCEACQQRFEDGAVVQTSLYDTTAGPMRRDLCPDCAASAADPDNAELLARWRAQRPDASATRPTRLDTDACYRLFQRMYATPNRADTPLNRRRLEFVLALWLMRKKVLTLTETVEVDDANQVPLWRFKASRDAQVYDVRQPPLEAEQAEELSHQLESLAAEFAEADETDLDVADPPEAEPSRAD